MKKRGIRTGMILLMTLILTLSTGAACDSGKVQKETENAAAVTTEAVTTEEEVPEPEVLEEEPALSGSKETESEESEEEGEILSFETLDLNGESAVSEEIFLGSRLTMINIWGTYCGPCIREMPELEELSKRLSEKNCSVIGIVADVRGLADSSTMGAAKNIIQETGVSYLNILPWQGWTEHLQAQFIPTSYFVDENGHIIGEPAVGARGADDYEKLIDDLLKEMP